jgi:hypothetical protein
MRSFALLFMGLCFIVGCTDEATETKPMVQAENITYAYTIKHDADYWEKGSQQNVALVLNSLKAFETGNIEECMKYFGDSISFRRDYVDVRYSKDSLRASFEEYRNSLTSLNVEMLDWETVISKDKKYEWVGLWYKEKWTDKAGKSDSAYMMDDVRVENGKIVELDIKSRHFPAGK